MPEDDVVVRRLSGEVRVASRIVDYLSSGLYKSPAACLKELVNNSYDADAEDVYLYVKPSARTVTLEDNGLGMTPEQFEEHFSMIAESHKRDEAEVTTDLKRKKIGKIGIGFVAANELCTLMRIESTIQGSRELLDATVDFGAMRDDIADRRTDDGTLHKGDYSGAVRTTDTDRHFTRITLSGLRQNAQESLIRSTPEATQDKVFTLYGMTPAQIKDVLAEHISTWSDFDKYSQTQLHVALNIPVEYPVGWLGVGALKRTARINQVQERFSARARALRFRVIYDGTELRKPTIIRAQRGAFVTKDLHYKGEHISYDGYLFAGHGGVEPKELQGILIRIREAAVGEYQHDLLDFPAGRASLLQRWVSGEIYAGDELEDAMNIDRSTLRDTHPAYVELRTSFHASLLEFLSEVRTKLYQAASIDRKKEAAHFVGTQIVSDLKAMAPSRGKGTPIGEAARIVSGWLEDKPEVLVRNMRAADLYSLVIKVAGEVLPPELAGQLLKALAEGLFSQQPRR